MSSFTRYPELNRIYSHYKGGRYEVMSLATHTETNEVMVVYRSILFGTVYVRPLSLWFDQVKSIDGHIRERFRLI